MFGKRLRCFVIDRHLGVVFPAAGIPVMARHARVYVVHINPAQVAQLSSRNCV